MGKHANHSRTIRTEGPPSRVKGRLVESIVAAMHALPGAEVRTNVRLPALGSRRTREIDVLIDGTLAAYPIRLAIECKNEKAVVGAPLIDTFVGKLQDVGVPPQHGIFVSIKGFTRGALDRARKAGIRTLVLTGLTSDRLAQTVYRAIESVVFLWPVVLNVYVETAEEEDVQSPVELLMFTDRDGNTCGSVMDLFWAAWVRREIPGALGVHELRFQLPATWYQKIGPNLTRPALVTGRVHVYGVMLSARSDANVHRLFDAETNSQLKLLIGMHRPLQSSEFTLEAFPQEADLESHFAAAQADVKFVARVRVPRIDWDKAFWPPSKRMKDRHAQAIDAARAANQDIKEVNRNFDFLNTAESVWAPFEITSEQADLLKGQVTASAG